MVTVEARTRLQINIYVSQIRGGEGPFYGIVGRKQLYQGREIAVLDALLEYRPPIQTISSRGSVRPRRSGFELSPTYMPRLADIGIAKHDH